MAIAALDVLASHLCASMASAQAQARLRRRMARAPELCSIGDRKHGWPANCPNLRFESVAVNKKWAKCRSNKDFKKHSLLPPPSSMLLDKYVYELLMDLPLNHGH